VGYSITLGEAVTLGIGASLSTRILLGSLPEGGPRLSFLGDLTTWIIGGGSGTPFPLVSVHLDEVWSITGNAALNFSRYGMGSQFGAGVLATF
jgi:hypothetical protein